MPPETYSFRLHARSDLPLATEWLAAGHPSPWWGAPEVEFAPTDLASANIRAVAAFMHEGFNPWDPAPRCSTLQMEFLPH